MGDGVAFCAPSNRNLRYVEASVRQVLETVGVIVKPITQEIAVLAAHFPESYPRDPADRLIGATARAEGLVLITQDAKIRSSPLSENDLVAFHDDIPFTLPS